MDRLTEMEAFATVVDLGGFTDAARRMGISKTAVSKHVASLEARLGARLLTRTTRRVAVTEIGLAYYDRARRVLSDAGEADALVTAMRAEPVGVLRVSAHADFGRHLSPALGAFLDRHPRLSVCLELASGRNDPVPGGFDVVLRLGDGVAPGLPARSFAETTTRLIAAPAYLARAGRPRRIEELNDHRLLHYAQSATGNLWRLTAPSGELREIRGTALLVVNDGASLLAAAIAGLGIAWLPEFLYADAARAGLVEEAMPELPVETQALQAVAPPGGLVQPKVRAFVDFLAERFGGRTAGGW